MATELLAFRRKTGIYIFDIYIYDIDVFTRVVYITWDGLWLPVRLNSCLYCEDVIKSKLIYGVLMRPKIRPKHV